MLINLFAIPCLSPVCPVGIEVVTADMDDLMSVKVAVTGAYGVFAVTNYWEHFSGDKEVQQVHYSSVNDNA